MENKKNSKINIAISKSSNSISLSNNGKVVERTGKRRKVLLQASSQRRRDRHRIEFSTIESLYPFPALDNRQKSSIPADFGGMLRLTTNYIHFKQVINGYSYAMDNSDKFENSPKNLVNPSLYEYTHELVNGFLIVLSWDGKCVFASPNVFDLLGVSCLDVIGRNFFTLVHPCDQYSLALLLGMSDIPLQKNEIFCGVTCDAFNKSAQCHVHRRMLFNDRNSTRVSFTMRLRNVLDKTGNVLKKENFSYRAMRVFGQRTKMKSSDPDLEEELKSSYLFNKDYFIGMVLPSHRIAPSDHENQTFLSCHTLDMSLIHIYDHDHYFSNWFNTGDSWYFIVHPQSLKSFKKMHSDVLKSGISKSHILRLKVGSDSGVVVNAHACIMYSEDKKPCSILIHSNVIIKPEAGLACKKEVIEDDHSLLERIPFIPPPTSDDFCNVGALYSLTNTFSS